jgi:deoxyribose-phosphate aldolase
VGLPKLAAHIPGGGTLKAEWSAPYVLDMAISAMGQTIPVKLAVEEDALRGELSVPIFLRPMQGQIADFVKTSAGKMLDKA